MHDTTARFVYPLLEHGLRLRSQLAAGRQPPFEREHARLKDLLLAPAADSTAVGPRPTRDPAARGFLGVRYALTCWADELFTQGTPWADRWNERKLEVDLYGTNDRAWKFWEQARLAEEQPGDDALEAFFLCVQLGFRGTLLEKPAQLRSWATSARDRLRELPVEESPYQLEPDPAFDARPRHAGERFERMLAVAGGLLLLAVPCVAFLVVSRAGGR